VGVIKVKKVQKQLTSRNRLKINTFSHLLLRYPFANIGEEEEEKKAENAIIITITTEIAIISFANQFSIAPGAKKSSGADFTNILQAGVANSDPKRHLLLDCLFTLLGSEQLVKCL